MAEIDKAQHLIEQAFSQAVSWTGAHWLVITLCLLGAWSVLAFAANIDSRSR